ncbi:MAG: hypothetical protein NTV55_14335 [Planctomycetota bacterium]|nr:hypothetical protein [Planctomycetota bacterium]
MYNCQVFDVQSALAAYANAYQSGGSNHPETRKLWADLFKPLYTLMEEISQGFMRKYATSSHENNADLKLMEQFRDCVAKFNPEKGNLNQFLVVYFKNRTLDAMRKTKRHKRLLTQNVQKLHLGCGLPVSMTFEEVAQERVCLWVGTIPDEALRGLAYYLFVDAAHPDMKQKDMAVKLGKSDKWVSENGKKLRAEVLRLVGEGDNGMALGA